jgi:predicted ATPase
MTVNIKPIAFDNQCTELHPWKQPRVTIILGGVGSGKTTILMNILNEISNDTFHRAIIFSSNRLDSKMVDTISEDVELYGADKTKLDMIIGEIRQDALSAKKSKKKIPKILLVLDDVAGDGNFFNSNKSLFNNFILSTRHYNTTVILTTQKYKLIPPVIRVNANIWFITKISPEERKQIFRDLPFPKDVLEKAYSLATSNNFSWLQINLSKRLLIKDFCEVIDV